MRSFGSNERGDSLLEIVIAIVIMGLVVGAFFATYTTQGSGSTAQRNLVTGDRTLRAYAEATKSAVRIQCDTGTAGYTGNYSVSFTPPTGYSLSPAPATTQTCPAAFQGSNLPTVTLTVTLPSSQTRDLVFAVRSPTPSS